MKTVGSRCDLYLYKGAEHAFFNRNPYFEDTLKKTEAFLRSEDYLEGKSTKNKTK